MMVASILALASAIALAWILASKRPEHRPAAMLLSIGLFANVAQVFWEVYVIAPLRDELGVNVPWTGWARLAGLASDAITLSWPAAIVGAILVAFAGRKPWAAFYAWAGVLAVLAVVHPIAGDGSQARALFTVDSGATVVAIGTIVGWYRRTSGPANSAQMALALIVSAELVSLLGAWHVGPFAEWPHSHMLNLAMFGVLILAQGRFLWNSPQPSS